MTTPTRTQEHTHPLVAAHTTNCKSLQRHLVSTCSGGNLVPVLMLFPSLEKDVSVRAKIYLLLNPYSGSDFGSYVLLCIMFLERNKNQ